MMTKIQHQAENNNELNQYYKLLYFNDIICNQLFY
jgi:hypothetical protein